MKGEMSGGGGTQRERGRGRTQRKKKINKSMENEG